MGTSHPSLLPSSLCRPLSSVTPRLVLRARTLSRASPGNCEIPTLIHASDCRLSCRC